MMLKWPIFLIVIGLGSFFIPSCGSGQIIGSKFTPIHPNTSISTITTLLTATPTRKLTLTPLAMSTPTSTHTATTIPSPTITTTPTPAITKIPTATPPTIPDNYPLPNWLAYENNVLMILTHISEVENTITFFNAKTHGQFELAVPIADIRGYFWMPDGLKFGFLTADKAAMFLVDTTNGNVEKFPVNKQATKELNEVRNNPYELERLGVFGNPLNETGLFYYCKLCYSYDFTYGTDWEYPNGESKEFQINSRNLLTGEKIRLTNPNDGIYDFETVWSPIKDEIAILQGPIPSDDPRLYSFWPGDQITIYDATNGNIVATYTGKYASIRWNWSPDGDKILYRDPVESIARPCILYLATGQTKCIDIIQNTHQASGLTYFEWSQDGKQIYYIYDKYGQSSRSDLCMYDLQSEDIFCPTRNLSELDKLTVIGYSVSPDGQYFVFSYGNTCNECDFWGPQSIGIVRRDSNDFLLIGQQVQLQIGGDFVYFPAYIGSLWRSNITP